MQQNKMGIADSIYIAFIKSLSVLFSLQKIKKKRGIYKNFLIQFEPKFEKFFMSSDQEIVVAAVRATKKLTIDSEQQERKEQEEKQRLEEIQRRKEEKRKRREQAEREEMERIKLQEEKEKKYDQPEMMFVEDSDDGIEFKRVVKKIKRIFPNQVNNFEAPPKKKNFIVPDDEDEDQSESESGSYDEESSSSEQQSNHKRSKKDKIEAKIEKKKEKKVVEKKPVQKKKVEPVVKKENVKVESKSDRKQQLVKQVSVRWWYALPEWPPADFDYTGKLEELGYRALNAEKFKLQPQFVNGLEKVQPVDGYLGVYKSKTKIIDVRPKQSAPTKNNLRSKSTEYLTEMLKKALTNQIEQLKQVKHQQKGQQELLVDLQRQLIKLKQELQRKKQRWC